MGGEAAYSVTLFWETFIRIAVRATLEALFYK
jgi:hypothetical protein